MKGRASLPGADELFRVTSIDTGRGKRADRRTETDEAGARAPSGEARRASAQRGTRTSSGRQRHEEKITFYCTAEELLELEQARLLLRREHGIAVDRGRIVREALAQVLGELEKDGAASALVQRFRQ